MRAISLKKNHHRKRPRPSWAATVLLASALFFPHTSYGQTVSVPLSPLPSESPSFLTPAPVQSPTAPPTVSTNAPTPQPTRQEELPILLEIVLEYIGTSFYQLTTDMTEVLEEYLLTGLSSAVAATKDVVLGADLTVRQRRILQRDIVVRVDGIVLYNIKQGDCLRCIQDDLTAELGRLLTEEALDQVISVGLVDDVASVKEVREVVLLSEETEDGSDTITLSRKNEAGETKTDGRGNKLERPSQLSIIFGFVLTGLGALGLFFYMYLFCKKRHKRQKKAELQRRNAQYRMAGASRVTPTGQPIVAPVPVMPPKPPPSIPTTATTPAQEDDQSDASGFKLETMSSDVGAADDFARELQMAASLDEQAWEDFQRKKSALDTGGRLEALGSTSPIIPAPPGKRGIEVAEPPAESNTSWFKSFPYGDEQREEGVEITAEMAKQQHRSNHARDGMQPEEKKEDYDFRKDPEPTLQVSEQTSSVLQSVEHTVSDYNGAPRDSTFTNVDTKEVVDEVARLSRFVQRYEKRKERRIQYEVERASQVGAPTPSSDVSRHVSLDGSISSKESFFPKGRVQQRGNENMAHIQNKRQNLPPPSQSRGTDKSKPGPAYRGITMAGELYSDPTYDDNMAAPSYSMSTHSGDSFDFSREEDGSSKSGQRLGITPFSVQAGYVEDIVSQQASEPEPRRQVASESIRARLRALRSNEAIIDSSQSDVNFGSQRNPARIPLDEPNRPNDLPQSRIPWLNKTPRPTPPPKTDNPKFNKLRNLFEEKPKNAIFPPDEHWQSGKIN